MFSSFLQSLVLASLHGTPGCLSLSMASKTEELFDAVQSDTSTIERIEQLITGGADAKAIDVDGGTALMAVSASGKADVAALLLRHGANANAANYEGWTSLMAASFGGHDEVVGLLLDCNADTRATDSGGWTALMFASGGGE